MTDDEASPPPPEPRTFGLNSEEFYEFIVGPRVRPWIPNGALPREPRLRPYAEVVIERSKGTTRRRR